MNSFIPLSLALILSVNLYAEDLEADLGGFDEEVVVSEEEALSELDGFDDVQLIEEVKPIEVVKEDAFSTSGNVAFKTSYGFKSHEVDGVDYEGFNQAQSSVYLQFDGKISDDWKVRISGDAFYDAIYDTHPSKNYNNDVLDAYKTQLRFDDVYIQGRLNADLDLKVGRQIVVWGKSDSIRVTDVINPTDNRFPGTTDIEDLRLSVGMAKLDYYVGAWNLSVMLIGENRTFIESPVRGEFFPVDKIFPTAPNPFPELASGSTSVDDMQYALAMNGVFSGWDLSFYSASVLDQKWHLDGANQRRVVGTVDMLGSAVNIAMGAWLLKSEVAYLQGIKYNSTKDAKNRLDVLVGFDYMGIKDTVFSLEVVNRHIYDYESQMSQVIPAPDYVDKDEVQTAMRVTRSFSNDTINASALVSMFGSSWEYGGFARIWAEYDVMDGVVANFGFIDYIDGDKPFTKAIKDNDKVFADITYSF